MSLDGTVDPWPACGYRRLAVDERGWLRPTDDWWRGLLGRPELALVDESCRAERRLHRALTDSPTRTVGTAELAAVRDTDARENHRHFLAFRDALLAAGTLEAWTLKLFRSGRITLPPLFIDLVVQAIVRGMAWKAVEDALEWRAAELLFRPQRITQHEGRVLSGRPRHAGPEPRDPGPGRTGPPAGRGAGAVEAAGPAGAGRRQRRALPRARRAARVAHAASCST